MFIIVWHEHIVFIKRGVKKSIVLAFEVNKRINTIKIQKAIAKLKKKFINKIKPGRYCLWWH